MGHRYPTREIALQAALSEATVDRVLNGRSRVRPVTAHRVHQAIADLDRSQTQPRLGGRTLIVDVVRQAADQFSSAIRHALDDELPSLNVLSSIDFQPGLSALK